jgi:hypothetical protein
MPHAFSLSIILGVVVYPHLHLEDHADLKDIFPLSL